MVCQVTMVLTVYLLWVFLRIVISVPTFGNQIKASFTWCLCLMWGGNILSYVQMEGQRLVCHHTIHRSSSFPHNQGERPKSSMVSFCVIYWNQQQWFQNSHCILFGFFNLFLVLGISNWLYTQYADSYWLFHVKCTCTHCYKVLLVVQGFVEMNRSNQQCFTIYVSFISVVDMNKNKDNDRKLAHAHWSSLPLSPLKVVLAVTSWVMELRMPWHPVCFTYTSIYWMSLVSYHLSWRACHHQGKVYMGPWGIE